MTSPIKTGDSIPAATLNTLNTLNTLKDSVEPVSTSEFFADAKVVLFAVPGAFTPTCSNRHLPGYVEHLAAFESRDIKVACLSVNDAFVMHAWAQMQQVPASLTMLADGNGSFAKALGMDMDGTGFGMGLRAKRFALYAVNGVVKIMHAEAPGEFRVSSAEAMLEAIDAL